MQTSTNRRGALLSLAKAAAATGALSIACGVSQCTTKADAATVDRSAWDRAYRKMIAAQKAEVEQEHAHDAAWKAWEKNKPSPDGIALRRVAFLISEAQRHELLHKTDLAQLHADYVDARGKTWNSRDPEAQIARHRETCHQIAQYRRRYQRVWARYAPEIERADELSQAAYQARWDLFDIPSPDLAALHWKITHLFRSVIEEGDDSSTPWHADIVEQFMSDVRRLLPKEG